MNSPDSQRSDSWVQEVLDLRRGDPVSLDQRSWLQSVVEMLIVLGIIAAVFGLIKFLLSWYGLRQIDEYHVKYRDLVEAICNYRAEKGVLPKDLEDLVPDYYDDHIAHEAYYRFPYNLSSDDAIFGEGGTLCITHTNPFVRAELYYSFDQHTHVKDRGWVKRGSAEYAKVNPSVPGLNGADLVTARLALYDRRIMYYEKTHQATCDWYSEQKQEYLQSINSEE